MSLAHLPQGIHKSKISFGQVKNRHIGLGALS